MSSTPFDVTKLPRARLLEEAFPGQTLPSDGWGKVRCTLPGCEHTNGDRSPSLRVNVESGGFECLRSGRQGSGWKALVTEWWGEDRWREVLREAFPREGGRGRQPTLDERWGALSPEVEWTSSLGISPDISGRFLRSGVRYPGDPCSQSVIGIRSGGRLVALKWRLPPGALWKVGGAAKKDPHAKYVWTKGSDPSAILMGDRIAQVPSATVLVCAGEKDALVAASHLDRARWVPVSGCFGEGKVPRELADLVAGRRVVVAYDGDEAGRWGAWRVCDLLRASAFQTLAAHLPADTPPGKDRPGWDVSEVIQHRGAGALLELLEAATEVPDDWRPPHLPPGSSLPPGAPEARPSQIEYALGDWSEIESQVVKWERRGRGEHAREVAVCKFRGLPRIKQVRRVWTEDSEEPTGWAETEAVTYAFRLPTGKVIERRTGSGQREFDRLLDSTQLATATEAVSRDDRAKLYLWTLQQSQDAETIEERCAVGPHGELGWLSPRGVRVLGGRVERTKFRVGEPLEAEEFKRYRLEPINSRAFAEVCRWIVRDLIRCDHAEGAYTLPMLGAFMAAPLWEYVRELQSWQRYAFFIQGPSGVGKSQLSRYLWSLWGDFTRGEGLTTFLSSATYLEGLLHHARAVPVFVSDFKRGNMDRTAYRSAMGLLQAYADRSSRGRALRGSGDLDKKRPPRCTWIIDGEDLPEGEQSTLGRLVVLEVAAAGPTQRCASADDTTLDPMMVAQLPGVTARWIAWVQLNTEPLGAELDATVRELDAALPRGSTNRSRLVRSYAVQILATRTFLDFLEHAGGVGDLERLRLDAWRFHLEMATKQLRTVAAEAAGDQFLAALTNLLNSGTVQLRPQEGDDRENPLSGPYPFGRPPHTSTCVGTYHRGTAYVWPGVAVPLCNRHLLSGGGKSIEFSLKAIGQQLEDLGAVVEKPRQRVAGHGHPRSARITTWAIPLSEIGGAEAVHYDEEYAR